MKPYVVILLLTAALALNACGGGSGGAGGGTTTGGGVTTGGASTASSGGGSAAASGGTPFGFETGVGGSGGIIGEIDAFGSIIINGLEMNTDDAAFTIEGESGRTQADLREGQYIVIAGNLGALSAESVYYRANLKGPVSAPPVIVDADAGRYELLVLGQTVVTSATTRFDGMLAEEIGEGDLLTVSGPTDAAGRVLATYVKREPQLDSFKAVGRVADLDSSARTFDLGGLRVSYAGAEFVRFSEPALSEGQLVEVRMTVGGFTAPADALASEVERLPALRIGGGAVLEVKGLIDTYVSPAEFTVSGIPVAAGTGTSFENGSAVELGLNVVVEVAGRADATGTLIADEIEFERSSVVRVESTVSAVDVSSGSITALGVSLQVRGSTQLQDRNGNTPFTLDDLIPGDFVRARGYLEGEQAVAVEIERLPLNPGVRTLLRGPVTEFDEASGTLGIVNVIVLDGIGTTTYRNAQGQPVDRQTFYDLIPEARELSAAWDDFGSLADPADRLSIED